MVQQFVCIWVLVFGGWLLRGGVLGVEYLNEVVSYGDVWERELHLPDNTKVDLGDGDYEYAVLFVNVVPVQGDVDLVVTSCNEADIYTDNIGYSYSHGTETLIVDVHDFDRVCLHIIGKQRKALSHFSVYGELVTRDAANKLASSRGNYILEDSYDQGLGGDLDSTAEDTDSKKLWEVVTTVASGLGSLIVFVLKLLS